jgi:HME family heavy-metal exporter
MDVQLPQGVHDPVRRPVRGAQQESTRLLLALGAGSLIAIFVILFTHYRSGMVAVQIMLNVPSRSWGASPRSPSPASPSAWRSLVGFISLTGIATRNGVLMVSHYIHLMTEERRPWSKELIIQGSQERVARS